MNQALRTADAFALAVAHYARRYPVVGLWLAFWVLFIALVTAAAAARVGR